MQLLDGKKLSRNILDSLKSKIPSLKSTPHLYVILVGDDPESVKYVSLKQQRCEEIGIQCTVHHLPEKTTELELTNLIENLNNNPEVTGFFIQLPLPLHLPKSKILNLISPSKDIDGLTTNSPFTPAVVRGVATLLDKYTLLSAEKTAVIINDSDLIGQPLKKTLISRGLKVEIANKSTDNLKNLTRGADLVVSATGVVGLITADYIKPGAIVVDVGGGDIDFASVSKVASFITPTVGGVGPMTIACLLSNLCSIIQT